VQQFYLERRRQNPTKQYLAINPKSQKMHLPKMLEAGGFPAELWEFSDYDFTKGLLIPAEEFTVKIDKVLHHRQFHPADKEQHPTRFFLFGTEKEAHLAHYMVWDEDYQLIVDLERVPSGVTKEQLAAGVLVDLHFETRSATTDPMTPYQGKDLDATVLPAGTPGPYTDAAGLVPPQGGTRIKVRIGQTRWFDMKFLNGGHGLSQEQGTYAQLMALARI
jgi:hypothetical protein